MNNLLTDKEWDSKDMDNDELIQALLRDKIRDPMGYIGGKPLNPVESLTEPPTGIESPVIPITEPLRECIETIYQTIGVYLVETEEPEEEEWEELSEVYRKERDSLAREALDWEMLYRASQEEVGSLEARLSETIGDRK